jgi:predicted branched-subunit amino acid permease
MTTVSSPHERFRTGVRAGIGFGAAAFVVGISFGVVAQPVMGSVAPIVMSAFVFAGASQFGVTSVLLSGGGALTAIATGAMLNARFLPMGVAAAAALRGGRLRRALEGQAIVDASWAFAARGGGGFDREAMLGATLPQYPAWVLGTVIGVVFGDALGDPEALGLDAIFPAFFLGLLAAELGRPRAVPVVLLAGAIALGLTPLLPPGLPVLLASSAALIGLKR